MLSMNFKPCVLCFDAVERGVGVEGEAEASLQARSTTRTCLFKKKEAGL